MRGERLGNRKGRVQRRKGKIPELGYYLIITDTEETEKCYFNGLRNMLPKEMQNKLVIKVIKAKTEDMIDRCLELTAYEAQYRIPWIVFDRDQVINFDEIIKKAGEKGIEVGWSNPCFEIWLHAYFGSMPMIMDSWKCCESFEKIFKQRTGYLYSKADPDLYKKLRIYGDENIAIEVAKQKFIQNMDNGKTNPDEMCPCSTVFRLIREINYKIKKEG